MQSHKQLTSWGALSMLKSSLGCDFYPYDHAIYDINNKKRRMIKNKILF